MRRRRAMPPARLPAAIPFAIALVCAPLASAAPPRPIEGTGPKPLLKPEASGYCQRTEFLGWSPDGARAAYSESYCRQPPADAAFDTLRLVARDGTILRWFTGAESGATLSREARAKLLFEKPIRIAGPKAPDGRVAKATITAEVLAIEVPGSPKLSAPVALPYPAFPFAKQPRVAGIYWAPDAQALAVELKATRRLPNGSGLEVGAVYFAETRTAAAPGSSPGRPREDAR